MEKRKATRNMLHILCHVRPLTTDSAFFQRNGLGVGLEVRVTGPKSELQAESKLKPKPNHLNIPRLRNFSTREFLQWCLRLPPDSHEKGNLGSESGRNGVIFGVDMGPNQVWAGVGGVGSIGVGPAGGAL